MSGGPYQSGNRVRCRFGFTSRKLTPTEDGAFLAGQGLPEGVGVDAAIAFFDFKTATVAGQWGEPSTLTGGDITRAAPGEYFTDLPVVSMVAKTTYRYSGRGIDDDAQPLVATLPREFDVLGF